MNTDSVVDLPEPSEALLPASLVFPGPPLPVIGVRPGSGATGRRSEEPGPRGPRPRAAGGGAVNTGGLS